jgi:hypothetical protein
MCSAAFALDPMRIKVRTELPSNITRVGEAAQYYAYSIGYRLVTQHPAPEESFKIANEAISPFSRKNTVLPIEEAILDVLSTRYVLVVDDEHKLFSFERGTE